MAVRKESAEEPSRAAGACVLVVLGVAGTAAVFVLAPDAGVLAVWVAGGVAVWRSARRMSGLSATPPPQEGRPSCSECAGHELLNVTPLEGQKGMLIYSIADPDRPNHTHVHVARGEVTES